MIMLASSAFVLTALTMTGVYLKNKNVESQDDGYHIDLSALENNVEDPYKDILDSIPLEQPQLDTPIDNQAPASMDDDLDYMPMEAGSNLIEIPGITDGSNAVANKEENQTPKPEGEETPQEAPLENETKQQEEEVSVSEPIATIPLNYTESNGLLRPVTGDILMHYSMDKSIYFATLDQYKYNPGVVFAAQEGSQVGACANGKVINIFQDEEIGQAVTLDLGNGYQATYGQLRDLGVTMDSYVEAGDVIGFIASPTKYYSREGSNLYFKLTKDGVAVNAEELFK